VHQADDPRRRATWHYWRGFLGILTGGEPDTAIDHCNVAAKLAADAGLDEVKAYAESCLAEIYLFIGRLRETIEIGERALASFEALGNLWWAWRTICRLNPAANALGDWEASFSYCRRALQYGEVLGDLRIKVVGLWRMGATYVHQGDPQTAVQYCDEALALGALPFDAAMAQAVRGYGKIKLGLVDAGIADLSEAVSWFEKSRLRYSHGRYSLFLAEGFLRRGDRIAARSLIGALLETSRALGYLHFEGTACWLMGECLAPEAPASAEPYVETAMEILEPEHKPIAALEMLRNRPTGGCSRTGPKRLGKAKRAAKVRQSSAKIPVITLPRTCGAASCATTTPVAIPGPHSRRKRMSVFPARQCAHEETSAVGRIAASEVPTAICAAWSAGVPASTSP